MGNMETMLKKTNGFMKGICHPGRDRDMLLNAGLGWVRRDIPYPYDKNGGLTLAFAAYKEACRYYAEKGIYTIGITPYPNTFIGAGIDVSTESGLKEAEIVCEKLGKELSGCVRCWQVTNEMHILHFRAPLDEEQAKRFIISCMRGLRRGDPEGAIGHNSVDTQWLAHTADIESETGGSDYIGLDFYAGTWGAGGPDDYIREIDRVYDMTGLPVVLMEFGFASKGGYIDHEHNEIGKFLRDHGFKDISDAKNRPEDYIKVLPAPMAETMRKCSPADKISYVGSGFEHILKKWWNKPEIEHTEDGQAEFYTKLLPMLIENPRLAGAIIYCWQDSERCFTCGSTDCPCETAWGLMRCDGTPKPAYEAVKRVFAE